MENLPEGWKIKKSSKRMENYKIFQKDGKLKNLPEGWKIVKSLEGCDLTWTNVL